ncbi:MAG TPA: hypothetical protein VKP88_01890 [Candidatus Paceibacterota bacterium]|nr:hypothetical protein [Candidatus Paceibacterota bacterium]
MFRAIGTVIVLLVTYNLFTTAFVAFENALVATFNAVEVAASAATAELEAQQSQ